MTGIKDFMMRLERPQKDIINHWHNVLTTQFGLLEKMRYRIPFYYKKSWICYLNPMGKDRVELAFTRGRELSNAQGLLDARGRKQVYGIILAAFTDMPYKAIGETIQEAILLDECIPYGVTRRRKAPTRRTSPS